MGAQAGEGHREREREREKERERERIPSSSKLSAQSPTQGLNLTNCEIMT